MRIEIPEKINDIINHYEKNGYEAYCVGGSIRDSVMGIEIGDWDITTSALPEETKELFKYEKIIETGIKHGTVSIIKDHEAIEVTTFRIEGEYSDNRHPEQVSFTRNLELLVAIPIFFPWAFIAWINSFAPGFNFTCEI